MVNYNDYNEALFPSSFLSTFSAKSAMESEGSLFVVATSQKISTKKGNQSSEAEIAFLSCFNFQMCLCLFSLSMTCGEMICYYSFVYT